MKEESGIGRESQNKKQSLWQDRGEMIYDHKKRISWKMNVKKK